MEQKYVVTLNDVVFAVANKEHFTTREIVFAFESMGITSLVLEDESGDAVTHSVSDGVNHIVRAGYNVICSTPRLTPAGSNYATISIDNYMALMSDKTPATDPVSGNERKFVVIIDGQTTYGNDNRNVFNYAELQELFTNNTWNFEDEIVFNTKIEGIDYLLGNGVTECYTPGLVKKYATDDEFVMICIDELSV